MQLPLDALASDPSKLPPELLEAMLEQYRRKLKEDYLSWCQHCLAPSGQVPGAHHRLIIEKMQAMADGKNTRNLMICAPPGSAKSTYTSVLFPVWFLGRKRNLDLVQVSFAQDMAERMARSARDLLLEHGPLLGVELMSDNASIGSWRFKNGSRYYAVGAGGALTGRRADIILMDDIVKDAAQAESEGEREKLWDWYYSVASTRGKPDRPLSMCLVMCMTGDTPVMMADGTETPLRNIRSGDSIATYKNGVLSTSKVLNWINHGPDHVYEITTTSGITVKANERHPFLVSVDGELRWVRLKHLCQGHKIYRVNGVNGEERLVSSKVAVARLPRVGFADRATQKTKQPKWLPMASNGLLAILNHFALAGSKIATALPLPSTTGWFLSRPVCALSANARLAKTFAPIGVGSCASTIATNKGRFARCCATTATLLRDISKIQKSPSPSQATCDFTLDTIQSIRPVGIEDVFDIEVAETENFIASGLVSHNTRWNRDDIAGRLLETDPDGWEVLRFTAIAEEDDVLGREVGEPLWNDTPYGAKLLARRDELYRVGSARFWSAMYQQNPVPTEGALFQTAKIGVVDAIPAGARMVRAWDLAATKQLGSRDPDWTVGVLLAEAGGTFCVVDVVRTREGPEGVERTIVATAQRDGPKVRIGLPQDPGQAGVQQVAYLTRKLAGFVVESSRETGSKDTRAAPVAAQCNVGNLVVLRGAWNRVFLDELRDFPAGVKDDQVDALSRAFSMVSVPLAKPARTLRLNWMGR